MKPSELRATLEALGETVPEITDSLRALGIPVPARYSPGAVEGTCPLGELLKTSGVYSIISNLDPPPSNKLALGDFILWNDRQTMGSGVANPWTPKDPS